MTDRLSKLEAATAGLPCPTCGHGGSEDEDVRWMTDGELAACEAALVAAHTRKACVNCSPRGPCPQHRGDAAEVTGADGE